MNWTFGVATGRELCLASRRGTDGAIVVATRRVKAQEDGGIRRRRAALRMVDRQLTKGNFKLALSLVKQLQRQASPAGLRGFAAARQSSVTDEGDELCHEDDIIEYKQVVQHEAGHFLVGYLLGVLPKQYRFSSMEDMKQDKISEASVKFVGFEFLKELEGIALSKKKLHEVKLSQRASKHKLSSTVLSKFACVILGGLVAEHLVYGYSKGHHADVEKLDRVLKWLQFTEDEANTLTRWAALNTLTILYRHSEARSTLVEAMSREQSIGNCIEVIETSLNLGDI